MSEEYCDPDEHFDPEKDWGYNPDGWDPNKDPDFRSRDWTPQDDQYDELDPEDYSENSIYLHERYVISNVRDLISFAKYYRSSMGALSDRALEIEHSDLPSIFKVRAKRNREFIGDCLELFRQRLSYVFPITEENPQIVVDRPVETLQDLEDEIYTLREEIVFYEAKTGKSILT